MISDIVKECIKRGFSSVEVSRAKSINWDYLKNDGNISGHVSKLQEIHCRAMYDYGDPVTFMLSGSDKRTVDNAFKLITRTLPSSGKENFRKLLPRKAEKIKIEIYDPSFDDIGIDDFTGLSEKIDETAMNFPGLKIRKAIFSKMNRKFYLINSRGFNAKYRKTIFTVSLNISLNGGSIDLNDNRIFFKDLEPFKLVSRGYTLLDSLTDEVPVLKRFNDLVFSPEASSVILKVFSKYFYPPHNEFVRRVNHPSVLNISDDPILDFGAGSVPFDDEGIQGGKTNIIKKGIFESSITDLRTSHKYGMKPTGNGFRRGTDHSSPGFTNLFIKPSVVSVSGMLGDFPEVILISLVKLVSSGNDQYLFSAYGYRYHDGDRKEPVHFFISTSFQDFFLNLEMVSKEIRFYHSGFSTGSPYLLLKSKKKGNNMVRI